MFTPPNKDQPQVKDLIKNKDLVALDKSGLNTKNSEYGEEGWESEEEETKAVVNNQNKMGDLDVSAIQRLDGKDLQNSERVSTTSEEVIIIEEDEEEEDSTSLQFRPPSYGNGDLN